MKIPKEHHAIFPRRVRYSRLGVTGLLSVAALALILLVGWILELGGERGDVREFGKFALSARQNAASAIAEGARSHRFVFLADIYGAPEPKRLAIEVIDAIVARSGLDAVVVEVGRDQQPYLDHYFDRTPEDASVLLSHPGTLREAGAGSRTYLALYRRIWRLNEKLGADRRIQVIAADLQGWPTAQRSLSTAERARRFADRGEAMVNILERKLLGSLPRARVLVFMSGLQALETGTGQLQTGGTAPVLVPWFAARMEARYPGQVFSVIVDAPGSIATDELVPYTGTRLVTDARSALPAGRYALPVGSAFDFLSRPIRENTGPGFTFEILPRDYRLKNVADLYIHLRH